MAREVYNKNSSVILKKNSFHIFYCYFIAVVFSLLFHTYFTLTVDVCIQLIHELKKKNKNIHKTFQGNIYTKGNILKTNISF
jgi:hypothetical protein